MHWSGEVTLGTLLLGLTVLFAVAGIFLRLGGVQKSIERLVEDGKQTAMELAARYDRDDLRFREATEALRVHTDHDETLFRDLTAALNRIIGKIEAK